MIQIVCFCLMKTCILKMHGNWLYLIFLRVLLSICKKVVPMERSIPPLCACIYVYIYAYTYTISIYLHICPHFLQLSKKYCEGNLDLDFRIFLFS